MTCRHVDVLAIALLLGGMALFSHIRDAVTPVIFYKQHAMVGPFHRPLVMLPKLPCIKITAD